MSVFEPCRRRLPASPPYWILSVIFATALLNFPTTGTHDFTLKIIAFNDFHGNLQSPGQARANAQSARVPVGGADYLAGYVAHLRAENPNSIAVAAGDIIGASPLVSALFDDEDTIDAMNRIGLDLTSVGNHEFDKGKTELLRIEQGGCSTLHEQSRMSCESPEGAQVRFGGARFEYLAANVVDRSTGKSFFPAYAVRAFERVRVAFIGLTLKDTPTMVTPSGVAGLRFEDEAATINSAVARLRKQGIKIFVVLIHQGGGQPAGEMDINGCAGGLKGWPIYSIVNQLEGVDVVVSGHTHQAYICRTPDHRGREVLVTSAALYGEVVTDIDVRIDAARGVAKHVAARNLLVDRTNGAITPDGTLARTTAEYAALAAPLANRKLGTITAAASKETSPAGESPLGDLIADAQLNATRSSSTGNAVAAFMNEGGIRAAIPFDPGVPGLEKGSVTYGELFSAQPFGNNLTTITLTGAQLKTLLEEQFAGCAAGAPVGTKVPASNRFLQVSEGFAYTWKQSGAACEKVDFSSIRINGARLSRGEKYRVTVNSFMADGGDQFYILKSGADPVGGPQDIDALAAYFQKGGPVGPPHPHRVAVTP